ncbi:unnamed protein product [Cuscuta campestris]|uniref:F-box domain-containing protein n=1 Tax=Cuscuta campestris TaxID=132261 RepID=A0A484LSM6_9ASTE|nr:unnamed protein product [Cuscuta campestris]
MELDLPQELITEILTRLPVKSLLRFTAVSKAWRSLIRSPAFATAHTRLSGAGGRRLFLVASVAGQGRHASVHSLARENGDSPSFATLHQLDSSAACPCKIPTILGACHGLICLSAGLRKLLLWNPSTRTSRVFPDPFGSSGCYVRFGFGYDDHAQDYKVVKICSSESSPNQYENRVQIYSLKSDSWISIPGFSSGYINGKYGVFLNGGLHWDLRRGESPSEILAVDLEQADRFRTIPIPGWDYENRKSTLKLEVLGGCLAACLFSSSKKTMEVWVMAEYGVAGSWTRVVSVSLAGCGDLRGHVSVLYMSDDRTQFLFNLGNQLVSYNNVNGGSFKKLERYDWTFALHLQSAIYSESISLLA